MGLMKHEGVSGHCRRINDYILLFKIHDDDYSQELKET
jgi:hypothetical protein